MYIFFSCLQVVIEQHKKSRSDRPGDQEDEQHKHGIVTYPIIIIIVIIIILFVNADNEEDYDVESSHSNETMLLTVEALKSQLEEQTKLCKEQV